MYVLLSMLAVLFPLHILKCFLQGLEIIQVFEDMSLLAFSMRLCALHTYFQESSQQLIDHSSFGEAFQIAFCAPNSFPLLPCSGLFTLFQVLTS